LFFTKRIAPNETANAIKNTMTTTVVYPNVVSAARSAKRSRMSSMFVDDIFKNS
jgi:hypothetical protein